MRLLLPYVARAGHRPHPISRNQRALYVARLDRATHTSGTFGRGKTDPPLEAAEVEKGDAAARRNAPSCIPPAAQPPPAQKKARPSGLAM
jgi:hypothetical protein